MPERHALSLVEAVRGCELLLHEIGSMHFNRLGLWIARFHTLKRTRMFTCYCPATGEPAPHLACELLEALQLQLYCE